MIRVRLSVLPKRYDPRVLPNDSVAAHLYAAAPAMLRLLASMSERHNAPAKVDIDRVLSDCGIEIEGHTPTEEPE